MNNIAGTQVAKIVELTGVDQVIAGAKVFMGIAAGDEGAGAVRMHIYHGSSTAGDHIGGLKLLAEGVDQFWYGPNGVACPNGIFIKVYSGSPMGSVFYK